MCSNIQINRTLHELAFDPEGDDNTMLGRRTLNRLPLQWQELLAHHRVVILSEAGSGKIQSVKHCASQSGHRWIASALALSDRSTAQSQVTK